MDFRPLPVLKFDLSLKKSDLKNETSIGILETITLINLACLRGFVKVGAILTACPASLMFQ
jgi:hypothetical protein